MLLSDTVSNICHVLVLSRCHPCDQTYIGAIAFRDHLRRCHFSPFTCGQNQCIRVFEHQTSLMRHIKTIHFDEVEDFQQDDDEGNFGGDEGNIGGNEGSINENTLACDGNESQSSTEFDDNNPIDLKRSAANVLLDLRRTGGVTTALIQRFQNACSTMIQDVSIKHFQMVQETFQNLDLENNDAAKSLLEKLKVVEDPFQGLKTMKQQLNYYSKEMGLVIPVPHFLGNRTDFKLNAISGQYEPVQVAMTFEYVPIIETLKLILSNPKLKYLIENEKKSDDGILRSYLDGTRSKNNTLIEEHPFIIRLQVYLDDVELTNPLGSRAIIHKLTAVYFSIQNFPPVESSKLSSIYLLALAYAHDVNSTQNGYAKLLYPFLQDLKKLESAEGVVATVNDKPECIRATLCLLCADTLAAHEVLGYLGPGARHFCRKCMISRPEFRLDCKAMGEPRTRASFEADVQRVKQGVIIPTECGIRRDCPLHKAKFFSAPDDSPFDIFHDLLEGLCHVVILLALRYYVNTKKYFTLDTFNERLTSFNFGIPDRCNKPSANFTKKRLKGSHFLQKGSQTWCLIRVFGFLVPEVPDDDPYLRLINILQQCMQIIFAWEIRPEDIMKLEQLTDQFFDHFQQMHIGPIHFEDEEEEEEEDADLALGIQQVLEKVNPINKLHHLKHILEMILGLGPPIRYCCVRYEARHHIFCKFGTVCCNFVNLPKTMSEMHQICTLAEVLETSFRANDIEISSGEYTTVGNSDHSELLLLMGLQHSDVVADVKAVIVVAEEFRSSLFILLDPAIPSFGIIQRIYSYEEQTIYFVVSPWQTDHFSERYCAYRVLPPVENQPIVVKHKDLKHYKAFAPWNPWNERTIYLSLRTIVF